MSVVKAIGDASSASSRGLVSRLMLLLENCGEFHSDAPKKADPVRSVIVPGSAQRHRTARIAAVG